MADIKFEIKETTGVLSESAKGWKKELNLISWNDKEAKFDIRDWDSEHKKMGKGVTLNIDELKVLKEILNGMELLK
ncbi:YdbC family protein [Clostridium sp. UBA4395]|uniref:YdbC family protein n=1 Tax=Clostridium sp. UBA4395 TaxID=1946360 RepID=UPI003217303B